MNKFKLYKWSVLTILSLAGCQQPNINYTLDSEANLRVQKISQGMSALKLAAGFNVTGGRSIDSTFTAGISSEGINFIDNPGPELEKLSSDASAQAQDALSLIEAVTTETTLGELTDKMNRLDPNMANDFAVKMEEVYSLIPVDGARTLARENWRSITINTEKLSNRGFLDKNWNWDTVNWYVGTSAASIAGIVIYRFTPDWVGWFPMWTVKYAGLLSAFGAYGAMGTQWVYWINDTEEGRILKAVVVGGVNLFKAVYEQYNSAEAAYNSLKKYFEDNKIDPNSVENSKLIYAILDNYYGKHKKSYLDLYTLASENLGSRKEFGQKLASATGITVVSIGVGVALCWNEVSWIAGKVKDAWNGLVGLLPKDINWTFWGVPMKAFP